MNHLYKYSAFGLIISSPIKLVMLSLQEDNDRLPDINIIIDKCPETLSSPPHGYNKFGCFNYTEMIFAIENVAKFYLRDGKDIIVERFTDIDEQIGFQIVSSCIPILLMQVNRALLHCSGVFISPKEVVLFAAPKNTGKTTLSFLLSQQGFPLFTDDTALLNFRNGVCYANASYPTLRMTESTIANQTEYLTNNTIRGLTAEDGKSAFYFHNQFIDREVKVCGLVFLKAQSNEFYINQIGLKEAFSLSFQNIYRYDSLHQLDKKQVAFNLITNLINTLPMWEAGRSNIEDSFERFPRLIKQEIIFKLQKEITNTKDELLDK